MISLVLRCEAPERLEDATALAYRLGLALDDGTVTTGLALVYTRERLELHALGPDAPGPVYVDFVEGRARHRRLYGGGRGQPLARAVGMKKGQTPRVVDATAGLGRDAFVLATLGCHVTLIERSPVIAALLRDGLARAEADPELGSWIGARMTLVEGDAADWLYAVTPDEVPDTVYLDPMYPHREKSALVKKEMRLFRELIGEDSDSDRILAAGLAVARQRVVVKRPRGAPALDGPRPSAAIESKNTRYDLYVAGGAVPSVPT